MRAVSIGEVLFDLIDGEEYLGGAPLNLAGHLRRIGVETAVVTRLGRDARGMRAAEAIRNMGVDTRFLQWDDALETGVARVALDADGVPAFSLPPAAYDALDSGDAIRTGLPAYAPHAVCFGTLAQRTAKNRAEIAVLLDNCTAQHVFFDVNIRMDFCDRDVLEDGFRRATIVKVNDEECARISALLCGKEESPFDFTARLCRSYQVDAAVVTMGADGCFARRGDETVRVPGVRVHVADTVGAGDAFSAAFLAALLRGDTIAAAAEQGNARGAFVAARRGALPDE